MIEVKVLSSDDYDSILVRLKSARMECETALLQRHNISPYHVAETDRQLELIEKLLKKEGL